MGDLYIPGPDGNLAMGDVEAHHLELEFLDGVHVLQEPIVRHLGGDKAVREQAASFKATTYEDFMKGFWKLVAKTRVNNAVDQMIGRHLSMYGRG